MKYMKNTMKGGKIMKTKTLAGLTLGTIMSLASCGRNTSETPQDSYLKAQKNSADYLGNQINQKVVYENQNGRMSYEGFIKVTGIDRTLPVEFNQTPVWVVVSPIGTKSDQEFVGREQGIRFEIPLNTAYEVLAKVSKK